MAPVLKHVKASCLVLLTLLWCASTMAGIQAGSPKRAIKLLRADVVATPELDALVVETLENMPQNGTQSWEHVGYVFQDDDEGYQLEPPQLIKATKLQREVESYLYLPPERTIVAIYHDHYMNTLPGPALRDGSPVIQGYVSYLRDARGNIYKIEYAKRWATEERRFNGWRLTTLKGKDLEGQENWRPGISFSRYRTP